VNRSDFQELAELHLQHARALLDARLYSGAFYMCGYAVECALKARICKRTKEFDFYRWPDESRDAWSHDFQRLIKAAGLESELDKARASDRDLDVNWKSAGNWRPRSRYERKTTEETYALFAAISDTDHGVLSCIKRFWQKPTILRTEDRQFPRSKTQA